MHASVIDLCLMRDHVKPLLGAFVTLACFYLVGVLAFYAPIAAANSPGPPLVPRVVGFLISTVLYILLFAWIVRATGNPMKAALAIALSQLLLVDVDYLLSGERDLATAAASAMLLLVSWSATGWVYGRLRPRG
jgi:hypothetical protein